MGSIKKEENIFVSVLFFPSLLLDGCLDQESSIISRNSLKAALASSMMPWS